MSADEFAAAQTKLLTRYGTKAISRFLDLGEIGLRVHVLEVGSGEPLLLLHGGGDCAAGWEPLLGLLGKKYHLFAPDRPGFGLSGAMNYRGVDIREHAVKFIGSVLDELKLRQATLVGNSMGGLWVAEFALAHPERVKKIVFVGGVVGIDSATPGFARLASIRGLNSFLFSTIAKPGEKATRRFLQSLVADPDKVSSEYFDCSLANSTMPKWKTAFLTMLEQVLTMRGLKEKYMVRDNLSKLASPVLFVWGDKDEWVSLSSGQDVAKSVPHVRFEVVTGAGHLPWIDEPDRCADLIMDFVG